MVRPYRHHKPRLIKLAKALGPKWIRVSGTVVLEPGSWAFFVL